MDKRDKGWMFALALAAGGIGGFVSNRLFPIRRAFTAQKYQVTDKVVLFDFVVLEAFHPQPAQNG